MRFGRVPGLLDLTSQVLYDDAMLVAGTATYNFFQVPFSGTKSRLHTNMPLAGVLASPQTFLVKAIRLIIKEATTAICDHCINNALFIFKVGEKEQIIGPALLFSAGAGTYNNITTDRAQNGVPFASNLWVLDKPIQIGVNQNFYGQLIYDTAPTTAQAGVRVLCVLDGDGSRGVQ